MTLQLVFRYANQTEPFYTQSQPLAIPRIGEDVYVVLEKSMSSNGGKITDIQWRFDLPNDQVTVEIVIGEQ